jgi:hypothetical protein
MTSMTVRWGSGLVAAAAQTALILAPPALVVGTTSGFGVGFLVFAALGYAGMLGLARLDTPRRLHALARELTGKPVPAGLSAATLATWAAALPGAAVGGAVSAALWWAAATTALVFIGEDLALGLTIGAGVVPNAAFVRAGFLASRAIGVTTGSPWFTLVDLTFAGLGLLLGLAVSALLAAPYLFVLFVVSAAVRGTI